MIVLVGYTIVFNAFVWYILVQTFSVLTYPLL